MRIVSAALLACLAAPAYAQDCGKLTYLTGVPISFGNGGVPLVSASVNQTTVSMILDTGGLASQINHSTAQKLQLREIPGRLRLIDVSGNSSDLYANVPDFEIGKLKFDTQLVIAPTPDMGAAAGLLAPNLLSFYDVDIDFGVDRLNFFSQDHCTGKIGYWAPAALAAIPFTFDHLHINIPVTVNGQMMRAIVDTGAFNTTMNLEDAGRLFGLTGDTPGMAVDAINGDKNLHGYRHVFATLDLGVVTITNPNVVILPNEMTTGDTDTGTHLRERGQLPEIAIGMNVLKKLHLYIAFREKVLYVAPADDKAGKLLPPLAAAH